MARRTEEVIAMAKNDKGKPAAPSKSKPAAEKKDQQRNPVLWPETTEKPLVLKKPTKKKMAK